MLKAAFAHDDRYGHDQSGKHPRRSHPQSSEEKPQHVEEQRDGSHETTGPAEMPVAGQQQAAGVLTRSPRSDARERRP